jgi:hypothetical protein
MFRRAFFICLLSMPASMASYHAMAADSCQPVFDALTKVVTTPNHGYSTQTGSLVKGKTRSSETIFVQGARYVRVDGTWAKSLLRTEDILQQEKENRRTEKRPANWCATRLSTVRAPCSMPCTAKTNSLRRMHRCGSPKPRDCHCAKKWIRMQGEL